MSTLSVILLVLAAAAVAGAEWPRLQRALGAEGQGRAARGGTPGRRSGKGAPRERRSHLRVVRDEPSAPAVPAQPVSASDADEFVASVFRDLERLPTADRDRDR